MRADWSLTIPSNPRTQDQQDQTSSLFFLSVKEMIYGHQYVYILIYFSLIKSGFFPQHNFATNSLPHCLSLHTCVLVWKVEKGKWTCMAGASEPHLYFTQTRLLRHLQKLSEPPDIPDRPREWVGRLEVWNSGTYLGYFEASGKVRVFLGTAQVLTRRDLRRRFHGTAVRVDESPGAGVNIRSWQVSELGPKCGYTHLEIPSDSCHSRR